MKARPIHVAVFVALLVVYHYGYIFSRPEMIREVILKQDSFPATSNIASDATSVIGNYFQIGMSKDEAIRIGVRSGMKVGRGNYLNNAEAKRYDETFALYKNINRGFAGLAYFTGCDNQVIVSFKVKDSKIAHVKGTLKKDCAAMP